VNHRKAFKEGFYEKAASLGFSKTDVQDLFIKDASSIGHLLLGTGKMGVDVIKSILPSLLVGIPLLGGGIGATTALIKHRLARDTLEKEKVDKILSQKIKDERELQRAGQPATK
jgi:hypothetical protein